MEQNRRQLSASTRGTPRSGARRKFLKTVPAALVAGLAAPALAQQAQQPDAQLRIPKSALGSAEQVAGLKFTDAEEDMALRGINRNLDAFETLRKMDIPLDTEPAFIFHPYLPGKRPKPGPKPRPQPLVSRPARIVISPSLEDLAFEPVTSLSRLIETRQVSASALTKMYLGRLKKYGETLKCVITLTEDLALAQAAEADKDIRAGRYKGPLHGIAWGAKDLFATKGIRTTWGAKPYENQVIDTDATVVERLRDAGAVLVAKLSMGALAQGGDWFGGSTHTPWNVQRSSSGSSAGPAAATSAGLVGFAIGTETLGSIISPSTACGVTGLRPTYGRTSRYGAMALSWTMDKIGPICRTVEDCVVVFNAIFGPDGRDESVVDAAFDWQPARPLSSMRIGYVQSEFESDPPATMPEDRKASFLQQKQVMLDALDALRKAGARLEPITLPDFPAQAIRFILSCEAAAAFDDLTRTKGIDQLTAQTPGDWPNQFRTHRFVPAVEYIRAMRARTLLMRQMDALMSKYDVFVSTTRSASLTSTNLTGHPALAMKAGFIDGMPVSLMITGGLYDEAAVLRVALAYERATKWHTMHPKLA